MGSFLISTSLYLGLPLMSCADEDSWKLKAKLGSKEPLRMISSRGQDRAVLTITLVDEEVRPRLTCWCPTDCPTPPKCPCCNLLQHDTRCLHPSTLPCPCTHESGCPACHDGGHDMQGSQIQGTFWGDHATRWAGALEEGKVGPVASC